MAPVVVAASLSRKFGQVDAGGSTAGQQRSPGLGGLVTIGIASTSRRDVA